MLDVAIVLEAVVDKEVPISRKFLGLHICLDKLKIFLRMGSIMFLGYYFNLVTLYGNFLKRKNANSFKIQKCRQKV